MRIHYTERGCEATDKLRGIIEKKLAKLNKFIDEDTDAYVTLTREGKRHIMEITIPFNNMMLRGEEVCEDFYSAIDDIVNALERQMRKHRTRLERRVRENAFADYIPQEDDEPENSYEIVRVKRFAIKPMDSEEAIMQMELVGHDFFVFRNAETEQVNVVYKRRDGRYGLIEPEYI